MAKKEEVAALRKIAILAAIFLLLCLVTLIWQGLELLIYGVIEKRTVDTIIAIILALSLYGNMRCFFEHNQ